MMKMTLKYLVVATLFAGGAAQAFDFGALQNQIKEVQKQLPQQSSQQAQQPPAQQLLQQLPVSPQALNVIKEVAGPTQEEEVAIGRQISGNLLGAAPLVKDRQLNQYVSHVGRWVASQSERPDLPWHFGVIESNDINAFAAPGGYIFITLGLYRLLQNEADLAGVLGHEIGHVIRKHHLKILQQSKLLEAGSQALTSSVGNNDAVQKLIGSGAEIVSRSLDKNAEFEADSIGVVLATRAGYDAYGLPSVLQQIGHTAKDDGSVALLFKTHPLPEDRLDKLSVAMGDRFDKVKGGDVAQRFYRVK
jgi:predicted Zn-dependent protease